MWPAFHLHKSLTWFEIVQIMPEHMFHFEDMWQEIRVKVTALLLCVNYQLLQCPRFCFWFVFHHSTTMLAAICTHHDNVMMDWNFWDLPTGVFFLFLSLSNSLCLCLSDLGGVSWFCYGDLLHVLYVSGATCVGGEKYQCEWKVFKAGLQEAKYRIVDCSNLCCVVCFFGSWE